MPKWVSYLLTRTAVEDPCLISCCHYEPLFFTHTCTTLTSAWLSRGEMLKCLVPDARFCTVCLAVLIHQQNLYCHLPNSKRERGMCQWIKVFSAVQRVSPPPLRTCSFGKVARMNIICTEGGMDMAFGENSLTMWAKEVPSVPGPTFHQKAKSFFPVLLLSPEDYTTPAHRFSLIGLLT